MSKKIRLNKNDIDRLYKWLLCHSYDTVELVEEEGNGIGSTVTAFLTQNNSDEGNFKVITSYQDW